MNSAYFVVYLGFGIIMYLFFLFFSKYIYQTVRKEGPKSHRIKNGTMTMGGIIFVFVPVLILSIIYYRDVKVLLVLGTYFFFGFIGFIDDILKVIFKNNDGLKPNIKLLLQVVFSGLVFYLYLELGLSTNVGFINVKWVFGLLIFFILVGSSNAFNLTDGLDGLCGGLSIILGVAFTYVLYCENEYALANITFVILAFLVAFYYFNLPKAYVFMGDVGSIALGAYFSVISILSENIILFAMMSFVFIIETLSVILQVSYFKLTKGKRIFLMSPLHHHFELKGYSEKIIIIGFYIAEILCVLITLFIFGYF